MTDNLVRHRTLKMLVNRYEAVLSKYGENGYLAPMYEENLLIPINEILSELNISYKKFEKANAKASRDKAIAYTENHEHDHCVGFNDNTHLYFYERKYIKDRNIAFHDSIYNLVKWFAPIVALLVSVVSLYSSCNNQNEINDLKHKINSTELKQK